ncbi:MAG: hypothetical protein K8E66_11230 [Phycisphaerales bacterium]|nr:hypothetical protein [Phycisphaerales bacterium]
MIVAGIALTVDVATAELTYAMSKASVNIKAAFLHILADALASVAVIVTGTTGHPVRLVSDRPRRHDRNLDLHCVGVLVTAEAMHPHPHAEHARGC